MGFFMEDSDNEEVFCCQCGHIVEIDFEDDPSDNFICDVCLEEAIENGTAVIIE